MFFWRLLITSSNEKDKQTKPNKKIKEHFFFTKSSKKCFWRYFCFISKKLKSHSLSLNHFYKKKYYQHYQTNIQIYHIYQKR